jgi:FkbM family methyltransferase
MSDASAPSPDASPTLYDEQTVAVMERVLERSSSCVDVGCFEGSILREMLRIAPGGRHFAFEPLPGFHARLLEEFGAQTNVTISPLALSDDARRTTFQHVTSNPAYSGFRLRRYDRSGERIEPIEVETDRLDRVLPEDLPVRFVKIDVEGAELEVLRRAVETIRRHRPVIVFEHGLGAADFYGSRPEDVHTLLGGECGMSIHLMERWLRGAPALGPGEFADRFHESHYYFMAHP